MSRFRAGNTTQRGEHSQGTARKLLAGFASFALLAGIGILGGGNQELIPEAQAVPAAGGQPASHNDGEPNWQIIPNYKAIWKFPLTDDAVYWATLSSDPPSTATSTPIGTQANMLWQAYDWSADMTTYKTRAVMAFKKVANGAPQVTDQNFRTQAIARIGGTMNNPGDPLSIYFWDNNAPASNGGLSCSSRPGHTPMIRITSSNDPTAEMDVYWTCAPIPDRYVGSTGFSPRLGTGESYGGEADQLTGNLYILSGPGGYIDNRNITGSNRFAASTQNQWIFLVWNPITGDYSLSGSPQPGDWYQGMTTVPQERVKVRAGSADESTNANPNASSDFALDADGNIYSYSGRTVTAGGNERNMSIVRLEPARDKNGNIIDGSAGNPWRYYVSAKIRRDPAQSRIGWQAANSIYGEAFLNGNLLLGASTGITGFSTLNPPATATAGYDGTTRMIKINPLTSIASAVWSIQNDEMPASARAQADDDASAQQAQVISGYLYNDANGDGVVSETEMYNDVNGDGVISEDEMDPKGIPDQNVALYDSSYTLLSVQQTDSSGRFDFIVTGSGERTYYVRPVQVQAPLTDGVTMVNAVQTWGAGSTKTGFNATGNPLVNTVAVQCVGAAAITTTDGAACQGAKDPNSVDEPLAVDGDGNFILGGVSSPDQWMTYAKATLNTDQQVPTAEFGFTTVGSYGDSPVGPTTANVPGHINSVSSVWLGDNPGSYAGPVTDDSHASDDGVFISSYAGDIPLQGTLVAAGRDYTLSAAVSGNQAANASVTGWIGSGNSWTQTAIWNPTLTDGVVTGIADFPSSGAIAGASTMYFRADASTVQIGSPTNANGEYYSASGAWMTPGEIEDYSLVVADSVYRPAVMTTSGSGTFQVDGQSLTAQTNQYTIGTAKVAQVDGSQQKSITATAPDASWILQSATVKDVVTGVVVGNPETATNGLTTAVFWTPQPGDDVVVDLVYGKAPDEKTSTLVLNKDTTGVGTPITGTVTVRSSDNQPLADQTVSFAHASADTTLSRTSCLTNIDGECTVDIISDTAKTYPNELSATVTIGGEQLQVNGSPATVTFKADKGDYRQSVLSVSPASPQQVGTPYKATVTVKDGSGNVVSDQDVTFTVSVNGTVIGTDTCTTLADGTCFLTETSPVPGSFQINAKIPDENGTLRDIQNSPTTVVYYAGPPCVVEAGCTPDPGVTNITHVAVTSDRMANDGVTPDQITAYTYDKAGNPTTGTVTITTTDGLLNLAGSAIITSDVTGQGTMNATSTVAGVHYANAFIDGTELRDHGSPLALTFLANAPQPDKSTLTVTPTPQRVDQLVTASVVVLDANDIAVEGATVNFTVSGSARFTGLSTCDTAFDGTCSVTFTDSKAEQVTVHALIGVVDVIDSPQTVTFTSGDVCVYPACTPDPDVDNSHRTRVEMTTQDSPVGGTDVATVYAFDQHGNPVIDAVVASTTTESALSIATNIARTSNQGTSTVNYTANAVGAYQAEVTINGTPVAYLPQGATQIDRSKSSPVIANFTSGSVCMPPACTPDPDVDNAHRTRVEVTTNDTSVDDGVDIATVYAFDQQGNPVSGAAVASTTTDPTLVIGSSIPRTNASGTTTVSYTSKKAGEHKADVTIDGSPVVFIAQNQTAPDPLKSSPVTVNFVAGEVCIAPACTPDPDVDNAHRTRVEVTRDLQSVENGVNQATVYAFDQHGNAVSGAVVGSTTTDSALSVGAGIAATSSSGTSIVSYTSTVVGPHVAAVTINGSPVVYIPQGQTSREDSKSSPITLTFVPGSVCMPPSCTPDPDVDNAHRTRVEVTTNDASVDGGTDVATVYAFDRGGNAVEGATVGSTPSDSTLTVVGNIITTNSNGESRVTYSSTKSGEHQAAVTINGSPVVFIPQGQTVKDDSKSSPVTVNFVAGEVCVYPACEPNPDVDNAHRTRVEVTTNDRPVQTGTDVATVYAFDQLGNPVVGATVTSTTTDAALTIGATIAPTSDAGTSTVSYTSLKSGYHTADVMINGTPVAYVPQGQTQPDLSKSSPVTVNFVAGEVCVYPACEPNPDVDNAHRTRVEVTTNDRPVQTGTDVATVYAFDQLGNPVVGATVTSTTTDVALTIGATIARTSDAGTSTVSYTSLVSGGHQAAVMINGTEVAYIPQNATDKDPSKSSPVTVNFVAGEVCVYPACEPDPDVDNAHRTRVEVTVNDRPVQTGTDVAMVYAFDQHGNPVVGATVTSTTDDQALVIGATIAPTGSAGTSTVSYTSLVSGQHTAAVMINGAPVVYIPQNATAPDSSKSSPIRVNFVSGGVCVYPACTPDPDVDNAHRTRVEVTTDNEAAGVGADMATVYAFDHLGNPVVGASVASTTDDPALSIASGIAATNDKGISTVSYSSKVAGAHQAVVTIDGAEVKYIPQNATQPDASKSSPITVTFTSSEVCLPPVCVPDENVDNAHRTRVEVTTDNQVVGTGTDVATVYAFDQYGNPVIGSVVASTTTDSGLAIGRVIAPTNDKGVSTVSYSSQVAGAHKADVTIDGTRVAFIPQGSTTVDPSKSSPITLTFASVAVKTGGTAVGQNSTLLYAMWAMLVAGTAGVSLGVRRRKVEA